MRTQGFPFIVWGSGGWTRVRFVCCVSGRCRRGRVASSRGASLIPCRADLRFGRVARVPCVALCHGDCCWAGRVGAAVPWGSASRARRVCGVCGAVPWGLLLGGSRGCRCVMGIAGGRVAWVALCHGDCWRACRVGGGVPWGLLLGMSRGCRCAMGIAARRVAWVALCHGDCCWVCREGGAVPWGLLLGGSRGWRCDIRIAVGHVAWVPLCHVMLDVRSCRVMSCRVTSCHVMSYHIVMSCHVMSCRVMCCLGVSDVMSRHVSRHVAS